MKLLRVDVAELKNPLTQLIGQEILLINC